MEPATLEELRKLIAIQAVDYDALWGPSAQVQYVQLALRYLTLAIEGEWGYGEVRAAIRGMMRGR